MKHRYMVILLLGFCNLVKAQVEGRVFSQTTQEPLKGVTITLLPTQRSVLTDFDGKFTIPNELGKFDSLEVSYLGYHTKLVPYSVYVGSVVEISLVPNAHMLQEVEIVNTGYQSLPRERVTGSFTRIDNRLLSRSVSTDLMSRLEGVTNSLNFDRRYVGGAYADNAPPRLKLRGVNTIQGNESPLIVVDNFPYDGSIESINPNDIESITVLKDAAAASIWGAQAGNGVIVITTKRGRANQPIDVMVLSNLTFGQRPNLFYSPNFTNSRDFLELELELFNRSLYFEHDTEVLSPFVEALYRMRQQDGTIDDDRVKSLINGYAQYDIRSDAEEYLYRNTLNQQYAVNFTGGQERIEYYLSGGYDGNLSNIQGNDYKRVSLTSNITLNPVKDLFIDVQFNAIRTANTDNGLPIRQIRPAVSKSLYPYARLVDDEGLPLSVPKDYKTSYIEEAVENGFLDWAYKPVNENGLANNVNRNVESRFALGVRYQLISGLNIDAKYQYFNGLENSRYLSHAESYYVRNLVNRFMQPDGSNPVPTGGVLDENNVRNVSHSGRIQFNYFYYFSNRHTISSIAGTEIRNIHRSSLGSRLYGYDDDVLTSQRVDQISFFGLQPLGMDRIPAPMWGMSDLTDRFISYYGNASYTFDSKYIVSGSVRQDASNLFGVEINQKWVPLWSIGGSWNADEEAFYKASWLPKLRIRATYGYNGNVNKSLSAYTTAIYLSDPLTGLNQARVQNAPNPNLRWEKVGTLNLGMDFAALGNGVSGSIEYYNKKGTDLIGDVMVDPTTGFHRSGTYSYRLNYAGMRTKGLDIILHTKNINKRFMWESDILFNYVHDEVTSYEYDNVSISRFFSGINSNPVIGKPIYGIYSYPWFGLDPSTGDPYVEINGELSKEYAAFARDFAYDGLVYHGPALPTMFGSFRNTFRWKQFSLSANVLWKGGYYFRRSSINYNRLFFSWDGHRDYANRWQATGDELISQVPSLPATPNLNRDAIYNQSEILVEKGDNIRLQDVRFEVLLERAKNKIVPFKTMNVFVYAHNLGILWSANKHGLDPDYPQLDILPPRTVAIGLNCNF